MSVIFELPQNVSDIGRAVSTSALDRALDKAPRVESLRDAFQHVIEGIHGLPTFLKRETGEKKSLKQLRVYIGRGAATGRHIRQCWREKITDKGLLRWGLTGRRWAFAAFVGVRTVVKEQKWEKKAQRLATILEKRHGLCVANIRLGDQGPWTRGVDEAAIYVVFSLRRGPQGGPPEAQAVNAAIADLLQEPVFGGHDPAVILAGRAILDPSTYTTAHQKPSALHSKKRGESSQARVQSTKTTRVCSVCKTAGHNKRTCGEAVRKKRRAVTVVKKKRDYRCGVCGTKGHNATTCPDRRKKRTPRRQKTKTRKR